jgi:hypothetical protein
MVGMNAVLFHDADAACRAASGSVAIENKQAGRRHGGSQSGLGLPIRFLFEIDRQTLMQTNAALSPRRWFFQQLCAMAPVCMMLSQTKCTQIAYCTILQLRVKGALAAGIGKMSL